MMPAPRVSIVIATYNSAAEIDACLSSIASSPPSTSYQVVVVDNASTDETVALVRQRHPATVVIPLATNLGFAASNNTAIRSVQSELLLLLNPDTVVRAGAIDRLVAVLDQRPQVAACGPRLLDADGRVELSFGRMMGPLAEFRQKLLVQGHERAWPFIATAVERMTTRAGTHDWVSGACLCVRRADADAAGLLDERYFLYAEDVDFCAALRARGRLVWFEPSAEVVHLRGRSRRSAQGPSEQAYRRSQLAFYAKHHPRWLPLLRLYLQVRGRLPDTSP